MMIISDLEKFQFLLKFGVNAKTSIHSGSFGVKLTQFLPLVFLGFLVCQFVEAAIPRTTNYSYDPATSLVTAIDGPRIDVKDVTVLDYDTGNGNLIRVTNALGQVTEIRDHDSSGRPKKIIDPNGLVIELEYHPRGWITSHVFDGRKTDFIYDHAGQLVQVKQPNGFEIYYSYDSAHRLTGIQDKLGNSIHFLLDAMGNRLKAEVRDNNDILTRKLEGEYDQLGRLLLTVGGENQLTRYRFDANGNINGWTDPRNTGVSRSAALLMDPETIDNSTINIYDALDRLIRSTHIQKQGSSSDDITISYSYNPLGQLETVTDPSGLRTHYSYNVFGDVLQNRSPDSGTTNYEYDSAGNLISQTDARGVTTRFQYDALNRLTLLDYPGDLLDVHIAYDEGSNGIGRLTKIQDGSSITRFQYDIRGQLTGVQQTLGEKTSRIQYEYDDNGNIRALTYPGGNTVHYQRDLAGQVTDIYADINGRTFLLAEDIIWQPNGPLSQIRYGNSLLHQAQYDLSGRMISSDIGELRSKRYEHDLSDNIKLLTDELELAHTQRFEYDALERLEFEESRYGQKAFEYDNIGNRTRQITIKPDSEDQVHNYVYGSSNHRLIRVEPYFPREYDAAGNTLSSHNGRYIYRYNDAGRLNGFYLDGSLEAEYVYNGFGERIQKVQKRLTKNFLYNGNGQLLSEQQFQKKRMTAIHDNVWLNGQAIAQIKTQYKGKGKNNTAEILYLHNDHLGTARLATDLEQKIVWSWESDAFGSISANSNPDGDKSETEINLRFPGQYYDQESGLHYNYQRYYDPAIGRYITSDPIGLAGGVSTYIYVSGNPLGYYDPYGLFDFNDIWSGVYDISDGWSPSPSSVNIAAGFGDGISLVVTLGFYGTEEFREDFDINWGVNECSDLYKYPKYAGYSWGIGLTWASGLNGGSNSVFWSGFDAGSMKAAAKVGITLEKTPIGAFLHSLSHAVPLPQFLWDVASATFAANAKGTVSAIVRNQSAKSTWNRIEHKILKWRGNKIKHLQ